MARLIGYCALAAWVLGLVAYGWLMFALKDHRCEGPARYEAMREAYEKGKPQPC